MGSDGSNPRRLTTDGGQFPSWSPDGGYIAFSSDRDGNDEIYVMDADGSNPRRLTTDGGTNPTWSPDGRHIAFESGFEICVMESDGSNPRCLTVDDFSIISFSELSWSPDGRHIAFYSGLGAIYVLELRQEGSDETFSDHGDSPSTATPVAVGESIEGEITTGDIDYFRVTVGSPGTLMASTTGSTDTYGFIEDSSGNVLHGNDDGGEGFNFRVSAAVEPGTYYIRVRGFDAPGTDAYTLTIQIEEGSDSSGKVWVVRAIRRLTNDEANNVNPSWSPDGRHLAFSSYRDGGNNEIYVMDADGSNQRRLTTNGGGQPTWSPDGRQIAFESDRDDWNMEIYVMDADGSNQRRLTTNGGRHPTWSPDGRQIAFISEYVEEIFSSLEIYVMDADGSNQRRLTDHSPMPAPPTWSPDGRQIAFALYRDGNEEIYVMDADGTNQRRLTNSAANDFHPTWSPDGDYIAFESWRDGDSESEIYVMGSDGSNPRRLTTNGGYPTWSPDGGYIAFESDRDGNVEIYVMRLSSMEFR